MVRGKQETPMNRVWGSFEASLKKKPPRATKTRCTCGYIILKKKKKKKIRDS